MIPITGSAISVYVIPADRPESDGTLEWTSTTLVVVEVAAGRVSGLGERIERLLFVGVPEPVNGMMRPDLSRAGLGLELKRADASPYAA